MSKKNPNSLRARAERGTELFRTGESRTYCPGDDGPHVLITDDGIARKAGPCHCKLKALMAPIPMHRKEASSERQ